MERGANIERMTGKPFIKQWAFTFEAILKDAEITFDSNQVYFYGRSEHGEFLTGFSSKISEAYRSAFLRVLQHFYRSGNISKDFYLKYAYATLPVELSRWKILPGRAPEWWPRLASSTATSGEGQPLVSISFRNPLEQLIESREGKLLVAAAGAIEPAEGSEESDPSHSFLLIAFAYKVVGSEWPSAEEIGENLFYRPSLVTIPSRTAKPFNFLEDRENHLPLRCETFTLRDILITPIVARERDLCIALWQYFRDYDTPFNLSPALSENLRSVMGRDHWRYEDNEGGIVAVYTDWLEGLKERYNRSIPIPHGQSLLVEKEFLHDWLNKNDMRLGYVLKKSYRTRKYNYEEVRKYEETKLLNVSRIIL
ncbi:MAG TPA: hypothetical protein DCP92_17130 [Nitrospiraceae bacterium]|jgi:hypothetical protein|nr:hypothetical protein [Nitrospiraceae bacterium]